MGIALTQRMKNWIEGMGVHVALANAAAFPTVIVTDSCKVDGEIIRIPLSSAQKVQAEACLSENGYAAIAPGKLGGVRAPYQFKGAAVLEADEIVVTVDKIYCTKPGYEAGIRIDIGGFDQMKDF